MADEQASQNWWSTLPGMLTASATAITAIGGLVTVLVQAGLLHGASPAAAPTVVSAPAANSKAADTAMTNAATTTGTSSTSGGTGSTATNSSANANSAQSKPTADVAASASAAPVPSAPALAKGNVGSDMAGFAGSWQNINPNADWILKINIRNTDSTLYVRAWAKCRPTDCDWGEVQAEAMGSNVGSAPGTGARVVTAEFKNNIRQTVLTMYPAPNHHLRVEAQTHFVDQSGRAPFARVIMFELAGN